MEHMRRTPWHGFWVYAENVPEERPGIYMIVNLKNKLRYIGLSYNIARRSRNHASPGGNKPIGSAIKELGRKRFLIVPLFYSTTGPRDLASIEADLIATYGSVEYGYNVTERSAGAGPYGPRHVAAVIAGHWTPKAIEKRRLRLADKELTKRRGDAIRAAHTRPEVKAKLRARKRPVMTDEQRIAISKRMTLRFSKPGAREAISTGMKAFHADPEFKKRHVESTTAANRKPERNAKVSASKRGNIWITDGFSDKALSKESTIPPGWHAGRAKRNLTPIN
jgi:group I intron endonuclease